MVGALLALFVASLTNTIIGIALPTIAGELGGQDKLALVASAALLTMTVSTPLWGKTSDLYGRKPLFLAALGVFGLASLLAGAAQEIVTLIIGRSLQGVGAAGILALSNALVADLAPPRQRAKYISWFGVAFGTASIAGPFAGGLLIQAPPLGWRWCFLGVLPFVLIAAITIARAPLPVPTRSRAPIDYLGAGLITAAASGLIVTVSTAGKVWPWLSWPVAGLVGATVALALLAVLREVRAPDPVLPVRLFRRRNLTLSCAAAFLLGAVMFSAIIYLPQYLQVVKGLDPMSAGLHMVPLMGGVVVASVTSGQLISRYRAWRIYPTIGATLVLLASALFTQLDGASSAIEISLFMAVLGVGIGFTNQIMILVAQDSVPPSDLGVATSTVSFLRSLGGTVGVATFGAILGAHVRSAAPAGAGALGTPAELATLPAELQEAIRHGFVGGLHAGFLVGIPVAALALLCIALFGQLQDDQPR